MKKYIIIVYTLIFVLLLCGCDPSLNNYLGDYPEVSTMATNSIFGIRNIFESCVIPIESDGYGRTIYLYSAKSLMVSDKIYGSKYLNGIMVCQKSDEKFVYFYSEDNLILFEDSFPNQYRTDEEILEDFQNTVSDELIEAMKQKNDWDEPINESKCTRIEITRWIKEYGERIVSKDVLLMFYNEMFEPREELHNSSIVYLTSDKYNRHIYLLREVKDEEHFGGTYAVLFNPDETFDVDNGTMEITDIYNYQDELKAFKVRNNWDKEIE